MNKLFDAFAHFNKFLDVIGRIAVRIAVLAVTIAVSKPVFNRIRDSSVEAATLAVERGLPPFSPAQKNEPESGTGSTHVGRAASCL